MLSAMFMKKKIKAFAIYDRSPASKGSLTGVMGATMYDFEKKKKKNVGQRSILMYE